MERGLKANHNWHTQLKASLSANDLRKKRKYNKIIFTLHSRSYYKFIKKTQYFETMLGCTFLEAFPLSMRLLYSFRTSKIHQMKLSFFEFTPVNNVVENNYQIKHLIKRTLKNRLPMAPLSNLRKFCWGKPFSMHLLSYRFCAPLNLFFLTCSTRGNDHSVNGSFTL